MSLAAAHQTKYVLNDFIAESKDGEWGQGEEAGDVKRMIVIRGTDFEEVKVGNLSEVPTRYISSGNAERKTLQRNDIIMEMAGGAKGRPTGRTMLLKQRILDASDCPVTCASFCRFIRIDPNRANPEYVYWLLQYLWKARLIHQFNTQHTGLSRFQYTKFATTFRFCVHSRNEQDRIADILRDYDDLIENNCRRITLLEKAARQLFMEWFVCLRFPGHQNTRTVREVPEGWQTKSLNAVATINAQNLPSSFEGEIEYVDISAVSTGQVHDSTIYDYRDAPGRAKRIVKHGDIIWSCVRPNRRSHTVIWKPKPNLIVSTGFAVISPVSLPTSYLYQAITSDPFVGYLENHAKGAAYPAVVAKDFEQAQILVPVSSTVADFDAIVQPMIETIHNLYLQNNELADARDLLIPRLMTGDY